MFCQHTQIFFNVWKRYGLRRKPKILLRETKQVLADKNLFGQQNFVNTPFNVIIKLSSIPNRIRRLSRSNRNRKRNCSVNNHCNDVNDLSRVQAQSNNLRSNSQTPMNIIRQETGCDDDGEMDSIDDESGNGNDVRVSPMSTMDYDQARDRNSSHLTMQMIGGTNIATKKRRETNVMSEGGYENDNE